MIETTAGNILHLHPRQNGKERAVLRLLDLTAVLPRILVVLPQGMISIEVIRTAEGEAARQVAAEAAGDRHHHEEEGTDANTMAALGNPRDLGTLDPLIGRIGRHCAQIDASTALAETMNLNGAPITDRLLDTRQQL